MPSLQWNVQWRCYHISWKLNQLSAYNNKVTVATIYCMIRHISLTRWQLCNGLLKCLRVLFCILFSCLTKKQTYNICIFYCLNLWLCCSLWWVLSWILWRGLDRTTQKLSEQLQRWNQVTLTVQQHKLYNIECSVYWPHPALSISEIYESVFIITDHSIIW